jgi:anthranilate synthase component I
MSLPALSSFAAQARAAWATAPAGTRALALPVWATLLDDQLTPVLAYRRLVAPDVRSAPSFLFESVEGGERQGRHSVLGAQPRLQVIAKQHAVRIIDASGERTLTPPDPLDVPRELSRGLHLVRPSAAAMGGGGASGRLPQCFLGGWVGFASYDSVRYAEPDKLGWANAPRDDRELPDLHFAFYDGVVIFDHVDKAVYVVMLVEVPVGSRDAELSALHAAGLARVEQRVRQLSRVDVCGAGSVPSGSLTEEHATAPPPEALLSGRLDRASAGSPPAPMRSNISRDQHAAMLSRAMEYIRAGDIFQVVIGQRFEKVSRADPFDVYRALRAVNPSPYMVYLQAAGCMLIASSPEILCRVRRETGWAGAGSKPSPRVVTNRPLAGTRKRGSSPAEDQSLERDLLSDPKELSEHIMLVDLGRNDVGKVARPGSIRLPSIMSIERYSHVMHISSTVTGELRDDLDCWDALRAALPVGTISGAPKVRAMQVIDELEPVRRGPYGGGIGYIGLDGDMDIALALRTIVVPAAMRSSAGWTYHLQAAGGIVADSQAEPEYQETVNKAAALERAIDTAERAFRPNPAPRT